MRQTIGFVLLATLLAGCGGELAAPGLEASFDPNSSPVFGGPGFFGVTRELAAPDAYLAPTPTAVVVLRQGQDDRNRRFCSGYTGLAPSGAGEEGQASFAARAIPTRWLLTVDQLPANLAADCNALLSNYDYARADGIVAVLKEAGASAESLEGPGPLIVEQLPTGGVIVVNGSKYSAGQLSFLASQWVQVAGQMAPIGGGKDTPVVCSLLASKPAECNLERMALETTASYLKSKFPEASIGFATGQRVVCALMPAQLRSIWCKASKT